MATAMIRVRALQKLDLVRRYEPGDEFEVELETAKLLARLNLVESATKPAKRRTAKED